MPGSSVMTYKDLDNANRRITLSEPPRAPIKRLSTQLVSSPLRLRKGVELIRTWNKPPLKCRIRMLQYPRRLAMTTNALFI
jgi:hypothetical protein